MHVERIGESMNDWLLLLHNDPSDCDPYGGGACAPKRASCAQVGSASGLEDPGQSPLRMYRVIESDFWVMACMSWE